MSRIKTLAISDNDNIIDTAVLANICPILCILFVGRAVAIEVDYCDRPVIWIRCLQGGATSLVHSAGDGSVPL